MDAHTRCILSLSLTLSLKTTLDGCLHQALPLQRRTAAQPAGSWIKTTNALLPPACVHASVGLSVKNDNVQHVQISLEDPSLAHILA